MIYAEHIVGLRAQEGVNPDEPGSAVSVRARFERINQGGVLRPRQEKVLGEDGSLFALDRLAGDAEFVFLSCGSRYRSMREKHLCYGWAFDAQRLVAECGALVGPDLMGDYDDLLDMIIRQIDEELPPLPMVGDDEVAGFMAMMGESDPGLAAYLKERSVSRYHEIDLAVRRGDLGVEGAEEAIGRFCEAVPALQRRLRKGGAEALVALRPGMEILVPGELQLELAICTIEDGRFVER